MADATGSQHNRFGMSVNQSADVHASGVLSKTLIISSKLATIFQTYFPDFQENKSKR
jgi:hypothetical protein